MHVMLVGLRLVSAGGGAMLFSFYGCPYTYISCGPSLLRIPPPLQLWFWLAQLTPHRGFVGFYDPPHLLFFDGTLSWMVFFLSHRESLLSAVASSFSPRSK